MFSYGACFDFLLEKNIYLEKSFNMRFYVTFCAIISIIQNFCLSKTTHFDITYILEYVL